MAGNRTRPYRPGPQECAILLLLLIQAKASEAGKEANRIRLSEITLNRLWQRHRLDGDFLADVTEWMYRAGWALFYAGTTFGLVRTGAVEGWPRISSKRLAPELKQVADGRFDFSQHYHLLTEDESDDADED
jgi:hypothetical protein